MIKRSKEHFAHIQRIRQNGLWTNASKLLLPIGAIFESPRITRFAKMVAQVAEQWLAFCNDQSSDPFLTCFSLFIFFLSISLNFITSWRSWCKWQSVGLRCLLTWVRFPRHPHGFSFWVKVVRMKQSQSWKNCMI